MSRRTHNAAAAVLVVLLAAASLTAQETRLPDGAGRGSQPAELHQRMGGTEIRIRYNRPSARGRALFGGLIPYDEIWHPGADEATRLRTSRDILVDGEPLPAGEYSLWTIPGPDRWTVIFSRAFDVFHTPYPEGQDALRLTVRPDSAPHVESLTFHFPMARRDSARLELRWGRVAIPFDIRTTGHEP